MEIYKNEYEKEEDYMMWELHEIRNRMKNDNKNIIEINKDAENIIKKYNLTNLKIIERVPEEIIL